MNTTNLTSKHAILILFASFNIFAFYLAWNCLEVGGPDSGRVAMISYWNYYFVSYQTLEDVMLVGLSLLLTIGPFAAASIILSRPRDKILAAVLISGVYMADWLCVRHRELSIAASTDDHGIPGWVYPMSTILLAVVVCLYVYVVCIRHICGYFLPARNQKCRRDGSARRSQ